MNYPVRLGQYVLFIVLFASLQGCEEKEVVAPRPPTAAAGETNDAPIELGDVYVYGENPGGGKGPWGDGIGMGGGGFGGNGGIGGYGGGSTSGSGQRRWRWERHEWSTNYNGHGCSEYQHDALPNCCIHPAPTA